MTRLLIVLLAAATALSGQTWTMAKQYDPLREISFQQWTLRGEFLIAPRGTAPGTRPALVVRCQPGRHSFGHTRGTFLNGYIFVGSTLDASEPGAGGEVIAQFRLDSGRLQTAEWEHSTDFSSVFFSAEDLNNFLYGHLLPHKSHTNLPVKKVIVGLDQFLGGEVEMEFDMPDPSKVGDACGVIWHRKADPRKSRASRHRWRLAARPVQLAHQSARTEPRPARRFSQRARENVCGIGIVSQHLGAMAAR